MSGTLPAKPQITVAELEQLLATRSVSNKAQALLRVQLSGRVSPATLLRLEQLVPGARIRAALWLLADEAAALPLVSESAAPAPPDEPMRKAILYRARDFVNQYTARLPNLSALRSTTVMEVLSKGQLRQEELALQMQQWNQKHLPAADIGVVEPARDDSSHLFLLGTWENFVIYRNGREEYSSSTHVGVNFPRPAVGAATRGEFGPALMVVFGDADKAGSFQRRRWEQGANGLLAVFAYSVPATASHFTVSSTVSIVGIPQQEAQLPPYHGEVAVSVEDGAIEHFSVIVDATEPGTNSWLLTIHYAPVEIGGRKYWCPIYGGAVAQVAQGPSDKRPPTLFVNHTEFTGFHLFRSDSRIIP